MGLIDKNASVPMFDKQNRKNQGASLLSIIYASHWYWYEPKIDIEKRKDKLAHRLIAIFDIFKQESGSYGEEGKDVIDQFDSQYTIGHDMGIWIDSELHLSDYAKEVANNKVTVRNYITRVFLNLFVYLDGRYTHILHDVCDYLEKQSLTTLTTEDIMNALKIDGGTAREKTNIIYNYFLDTELFITTSEYNNDKVETNLFSGSFDNESTVNKTKKNKIVRGLIFAPGYSPQTVKKMCNLEYKGADADETRTKFKNKLTYSKYIAKPIKQNEEELSKQIKDPSFEYKNEVQQKNNNYLNALSNDESKMRSNTLQQIIYGPPGTGKSYGITNEIRSSYPNFDLTIDNPFVFRTTLHPEYTYNDFVGQIMPVVKDEKITYDFKPGIFTQALKAAILNINRDVYLILEEMSRANVAAVFGDIFQLLDRKNGVSEYRINHDLISKEINKSNQKIFLPSNFHIIGTVNTSDQNVYVMDTAFKRRFDFEYMDLEPITDSTGILNNYPMNFFNSNNTEISSDWIEFYQAFNNFIITRLNLSEDKQLGQFFIKFSDDIAHNKKAIYNKLLQYIWQDIHLVSYANTKLFTKEVDSFSKAHHLLKRSLEDNVPISIFSDEFLLSLSLLKDKEIDE